MTASRPLFPLPPCEVTRYRVEYTVPVAVELGARDKDEAERIAAALIPWGDVAPGVAIGFPLDITVKEITDGSND